MYTKRQGHDRGVSCCPVEINVNIRENTRKRMKYKRKWKDAIGAGLTQFHTRNSLFAVYVCCSGRDMPEFGHFTADCIILSDNISNLIHNYYKFSVQCRQA